MNFLFKVYFFYFMFPSVCMLSKKRIEKRDQVNKLSQKIQNKTFNLSSNAEITDNKSKQNEENFNDENFLEEILSDISSEENLSEENFIEEDQDNDYYSEENFNEESQNEENPDDNQKSEDNKNDESKLTKKDFLIYWEKTSNDLHFFQNNTINEIINKLKVDLVNVVNIVNDPSFYDLNYQVNSFYNLFFRNTVDYYQIFSELKENITTLTLSISEEIFSDESKEMIYKVFFSFLKNIKDSHQSFYDFIFQKFNIIITKYSNIKTLSTDQKNKIEKIIIESNEYFKLQWKTTKDNINEMEENIKEKLNKK